MDKLKKIIREEVRKALREGSEEKLYKALDTAALSAQKLQDKLTIR
jgi:hypothetical protein